MTHCSVIHWHSRKSCPVRLTMTLKMTDRGATSIEVAYRGIASVAQRKETNESMARQFCFSGSVKI